MDTEHVQAVKARIAEIRRRFVDSREFAESRINRGKRSGVFESTLSQARQRRSVQCPKDLEPIIAKAAAKYGIKPEIIKAVIKAESGFRSNAVSPVGAQGLMQLMPGTARALGVDPGDPAQNIDGGTRYLRQMLDRFGSLELALAGYNSGPGAVDRYDGIPPYAETQNYVSTVLRYIDDYSQDR